MACREHITTQLSTSTLHAQNACLSPMQHDGVMEDTNSDDFQIAYAESIFSPDKGW